MKFAGSGSTSRRKTQGRWPTNMNTLSRKQLNKLNEYRDRWIAVGLSTDPADRERARRGVISAYAAAGLEPPKYFVWLRSPREGVIGSYLVSRLEIATMITEQLQQNNE